MTGKNRIVDQWVAPRRKSLLKQIIRKCGGGSGISANFFLHFSPPPGPPRCLRFFARLTPQIPKQIPRKVTLTIAGSTMFFRSLLAIRVLYETGGRWLQKTWNP